MATQRRILIVDDDAVIRSQLSWGLAGEYDVRSAATVAEAVAALRDLEPDVVTLDVSLTARPGESDEGLEVLRLAQDGPRPPKVVMLTASADRRHAVRAIELGAFDYCEKPVDLGELAVVIRRAMRVRDLEAGTGRAEAADAECGLEGLVGGSPGMLGALDLMRRAAETDAPVLLTGEPGTGKERAARAIHLLSSRASAPFVVAAAAGASAEAIETELFGPTQNGDVPGGLIAKAHTGTLYIDGVHLLAERAQARLAAFLARLEDERGSQAGELPDPRIVASAEGALDEAVRRGRFRDDLFYRIGVIPIALPPLRERGRDVVVLAERMLAAAARSEGRRVTGFTRSAERALLAHRWPGNADEMATRVRRAVIMARGRLISPADLGLAEDGAENGRKLGEARADVEREVVVVALEQAAGNVTRAARAIGVSRPTMYDLMRKHRITSTDFKGRNGERPA